MKTFKDLKTFEQKLIKSLCWEDYFKIDGKTFKIYEYGDLPNCNYVYFYNKHSKTMLYIKYDCPSTNWIDGVKTITKTYRFLSLEVVENPDLWRTDTL